MGPIAKLSATLRWDLDDFERGTARVSNVFKGIIGLAGDVADAVASAGKRMTVGLTLPLGALAVLTTKAASDVAELQSAFDYTFGAMAGSMNKWAEQTGNSMGRATAEMQEGALAFGQLFKAAAPTEQAAARMSQRFTELAQDAASFYNTDFDTAMGKIRSGLTGESEPLRDFGVFLNEAAVNAKGLELGLIKTGQELTEYGKVMARAALISESLSDANGDVERTSSSLANRIRKIQGDIRELAQEIGELLVPYAQALAGVVERVVAWFKELPEGVKKAAVGFGIFLAALGPLSIILSSLVVLILPAFLVGLDGIFPIISAIINPIGTLIVFAGKLFKRLGGLSGLLGKIAPMFLRLTGPIGIVISLLLIFKDDILQGIRIQWERIASEVGPAIERLFDTLRTAGERLSDAFEKLSQNGLGEALQWIGDKIGFLIGFMSELTGYMIGTLLSAFIDVAAGILEYLGGAIETIVLVLSGDWPSAWDAAVETVSNAIIRIGEWIDGLFPKLGMLLQMLGAVAATELRDPTADRNNPSSGQNVSSEKDKQELKKWLDGVGNSPGERDYAVGSTPKKIRTPKVRTPRKGASGPSPEDLADRREDMRLQQALAVARERDDKEAERSLQRQIDLRSRIDAYKRAGLDKPQAATAAEKDLLEIDQARAEANAETVRQSEVQFDMQLAELRGDYAQLKVLEDEEFLRKRLAEFQEKGVSLADAERKSQSQLLLIEEARTERAQARLAANEEARQIELARMRGDSDDSVRKMEERQRIADRVFDLRADKEAPMNAEDAMATATAEAMDREKAHMQGTFRDAFRGGLQAAMDGNLGQFFEGWMKDRMFNSLSKVLDRLADKLADLVSGTGSGKGGGGLGGFLGAIGGLFGGAKSAGPAFSMPNGATLATSTRIRVPKFATGGGGTIKGFPGIDSNLLSLNGNPIARVSSGELLNVQRAPANDGGGTARVTIVPTPYFDAHVDGRAATVAFPMSVQAAASGSAGAQASMARSRKRAMA